MGKLIVTIARQYGSGGKTIGQMLAENLGVNCYNREILRMASDDSGIKEELFNQADEKLRNNPLFGNSTRIYKGGLIQPDHGGFVSADNLFNYQAKVIRELAEEESCIIIGRCANYIYRDDKDCVSVYLHADREIRCERLQKRDQISEKEALKNIQEVDEKRAAFQEQCTSTRWGDGNEYDLCIDTGKIGIENAVEMILEYIRFENIF